MWGLVIVCSDAHAFPIAEPVTKPFAHAEPQSAPANRAARAGAQ